MNLNIGFHYCRHSWCYLQPGSPLRPSCRCEMHSIVVRHLKPHQIVLLFTEWERKLIKANIFLCDFVFVMCVTSFLSLSLSLHVCFIPSLKLRHIRVFEWYLKQALFNRRKRHLCLKCTVYRVTQYIEFDVSRETTRGHSVVLEYLKNLPHSLVVVVVVAVVVALLFFIPSRRLNLSIPGSCVGKPRSNSRWRNTFR